MRPRMFFPSKFAALSIIATVLGCDIFQKDADIKPVSGQDIDMYVYQNKAAVIDVATAFPNFDKVNVIGSKASVKFFSDRYIKYQSSDRNADTFGFSVTTKDNRQINAKVNVITGISDDNCGEAFTYARIRKDSRLVVNLYNNPEFCGYNVDDYGSASVADARPEDQPENDEGILLALCSCRPEGNTAILYYTPPQGFVGRVVSKYYLGILKDGVAETLAKEDYYKADKYVAFSAHKFVIDVVE